MASQRLFVLHVSTSDQDPALPLPTNSLSDPVPLFHVRNSSHLHSTIYYCNLDLTLLAGLDLPVPARGIAAVVDATAGGSVSHCMAPASRMPAVGHTVVAAMKKGRLAIEVVAVGGTSAAVAAVEHTPVMTPAESFEYVPVDYTLVAHIARIVHGLESADIAVE